jgi:hypothetical protein
MHFGFALAAIFSVATILISPATSDGAAGIFHRHHSPVLRPIVIPHLHDPMLRSSAVSFSADVQLTELLNRFRVRLC